MLGGAGFLPSTVRRPTPVQLLFGSRSAMSIFQVTLQVQSIHTVIPIPSMCRLAIYSDLESRRVVIRG